MRPRSPPPRASACSRGGHRLGIGRYGDDDLTGSRVVQLLTRLRFDRSRVALEPRHMPAKALVFLFQRRCLTPQGPRFRAFVLIRRQAVLAKDDVISHAQHHRPGGHRRQLSPGPHNRAASSTGCASSCRTRLLFTGAHLFAVHRLAKTSVKRHRPAGSQRNLSSNFPGADRPAPSHCCALCWAALQDHRFAACYPVDSSSRRRCRHMPDSVKRFSCPPLSCSSPLSRSQGIHLAL